MKLFRSLLAGLTLVGLSLLALPASAAKIYTMAVQSTGPTTVLVTIHNVTPENNSVINSIRIYKPAGATAISFASSSDPGTVAVPDNGTLKLTGFDGLKSANKNPHTLLINLNVTWSGTPPTCGSTVAWDSDAHTGNFSSTTFQLVNAAGSNISSVPQTFNCYTLTGLPGTVSAGTTNKPVTVTLTNTSALGSPSINGLTVSASPSTSLVTASVSTPISPALAPGDPPRSLTVLISAPCGATGGNWTSQATGTGAFSGTTAAASYGINPCQVSFAPGPPANIGNGVAISPAVKIAATNGDGGALPWSGSASFTLAGGAGSVGGTGGTCVDTGTCSIWSFPSLNVTGTVGGSYTLSASTSLGSTGPSPFVLWGGTLGCLAQAGDLDPRDPVTYALSTDVGKFGLVRGPNKPPLPPTCEAVPYTFTVITEPPIGQPQQASFIVPSGLPQRVTVQYVVVFKPVAVDVLPPSTGWTTKRPKVAWGFATPPIPGSDQYVSALACVRDPGDFTVLVDAAAVEALLPVIPNDPEFVNSPHSQYVPDGTKKAQLCVSQEGWTAVGGGLVQFWFKVVDNSDGFMSLD